MRVRESYKLQMHAHAIIQSAEHRGCLYFCLPSVSSILKTILLIGTPPLPNIAYDSQRYCVFVFESNYIPHTTDWNGWMDGWMSDAHNKIG